MRINQLNIKALIVARNWKIILLMIFYMNYESYAFVFFQNMESQKPEDK
jgi:hypothetical protein